MKNCFSIVALTLILCGISIGQVPKEPITTDKRPSPTTTGGAVSPKLTNLPDLKITAIAYDANSCSVYVEVTNASPVDARPFNVWAKFDGLQKNMDASVTGLAGTKRQWISLSISDESMCMRDSLTGVKAVADAAYFKSTTSQVGELAVGMPPAGMQVVRASVTESNESNNQMTLKSPDIPAHVP